MTISEGEGDTVCREQKRSANGMEDVKSQTDYWALVVFQLVRPNRLHWLLLAPSQELDPHQRLNSASSRKPVTLPPLVPLVELLAVAAGSVDAADVAAPVVAKPFGVAYAAAAVDVEDDLAVDADLLNVAVAARQIPEALALVTIQVVAC